MANRTERFDVLTADEGSLWEWAVANAGVENAATYIREATRDETLKAHLAAQPPVHEMPDTITPYLDLLHAHELGNHASSIGPAWRVNRQVAIAELVRRATPRARCQYCDDTGRVSTHEGDDAGECLHCRNAEQDARAERGGGIRTVLLRFIDTAGNKRDLVTPDQTCALLDLLNELHPEDRPDAR